MLTTAQPRQKVIDAIYRAARKVATDQASARVLAEYVLSRWHTGYIVRAQGGADEFGNAWPPLAPSTVERKARRARNDDRSAAWVKRQAALKAQLMLAGMSAKAAEDKAASMAWNATPQTAANVPINIDTKRLEQSLSPEGSPDQIRDLAGGRASLGTKVPYARHVNRKRRFLPTSEEAARWVRRGAMPLRILIVSHIQEQLQ